MLKKVLFSFSVFFLLNVHAISFDVQKKLKKKVLQKINEKRKYLKSLDLNILEQIALPHFIELAREGNHYYLEELYEEYYEDFENFDISKIYTNKKFVEAFQEGLDNQPLYDEYHKIEALKAFCKQYNIPVYTNFNEDEMQESDLDYYESFASTIASSYIYFYNPCKIDEKINELKEIDEDFSKEKLKKELYYKIIHKFCKSENIYHNTYRLDCIISSAKNHDIEIILNQIPDIKKSIFQGMKEHFILEDYDDFSIYWFKNRSKYFLKNGFEINIFEDEEVIKDLENKITKAIKKDCTYSFKEYEKLIEDYNIDFKIEEIDNLKKYFEKAIIRQIKTNNYFYEYESGIDVDSLDYAIKLVDEDLSETIELAKKYNVTINLNEIPGIKKAFLIGILNEFQANKTLKKLDFANENGIEITLQDINEVIEDELDNNKQLKNIKLKLLEIKKNGFIDQIYLIENMDSFFYTKLLKVISNYEETCDFSKEKILKKVITDILKKI